MSQTDSSAVGLITEYKDHILDNGFPEIPIDVVMHPDHLSDDPTVSMHTVTPETLAASGGVSHPNLLNIKGITLSGLKSFEHDQDVGITIGQTDADGKFTPHGTPRRHWLSGDATEGPFHHIIQGTSDTIEKTIDLDNEKSQDEKLSHLTPVLHMFKKSGSDGLEYHSVDDITSHITEDADGNTTFKEDCKTCLPHAVLYDLIKKDAPKNGAVVQMKGIKEGVGKREQLVMPKDSDAYTKLHAQISKLGTGDKISKNGVSIRAQYLPRETGGKFARTFPTSKLEMTIHRTPTNAECNINKKGVTTVHDCVKAKPLYRGMESAKKNMVSMDYEDETPDPDADSLENDHTEDE